MSAPEQPDGVDRRSVLIGLGLAVAAGVGGFAAFSVAGPAPGDDDGGDDVERDDVERDDDDRDGDRRDDDRSGSNRGKG